MTEADESPWYEAAFRADYLELYRHRTDDLAADEVAFLVDALSVDQSDFVLDLACGAGRHARAWSERGISTVGLDYSEDLITAARRRHLPDVVFLRGDMRRLPFRDCFSVVTSLFTSFGYFNDDSANEAVIDQIRGALRRDGRFVLDFLNASQVRTNLVATSEEERDGRVISQERWIDGETNRVCKRVRVKADDHVNEYVESVRLYELADFEAMFTAADLMIEDVYGDLGGGSFDATSPRLVIMAKAVGSR